MRIAGTATQEAVHMIRLLTILYVVLAIARLAAT
jgi:hypothetical protein